MKILSETLMPNEQIYINSGLVINCSTPWLAFSPDGFLCRNGELVILEVKCSYLGTSIAGIDQFLSKLNFLYFIKNFHSYMLKRRNKFFTQIQLALHITNLNLGKLIIYHKLSDSVICINVEKDTNYCNLISDFLTQCYATHVLPFLSKKRFRNYFNCINKQKL